MESERWKQHKRGAKLAKAATTMAFAAFAAFYFKVPANAGDAKTYSEGQKVNASTSSVENTYRNDVLTREAINTITSIAIEQVGSLNKQGKYEDALDVAEKAWGLAMADSERKKLLALILEANRRLWLTTRDEAYLDRAIAAAEEIVKKEKTAETFIQLAELCKRSGDPKERNRARIYALLARGESREKKDRDPRPFVILAELAEMEGDYGKAIRYYKDARSIAKGGHDDVAVIKEIEARIAIAQTIARMSKTENWNGEAQTGSSGTTDSNAEGDVSFEAPSIGLIKAPDGLPRAPLEEVVPPVKIE